MYAKGDLHTVKLLKEIYGMVAVPVLIKHFMV